jgi:D-aminoacyl-tRNA deacylase
MKIGLIISQRNELEFGLLANKMIKESNIEHIEIDDFPLYLKDEDLPECDAYVAVAIHSIADEPYRLCVHACGNWGEKWQKESINLGGEERVLSGHDPGLFRFIYNKLKEQNNWPVSIEATHHGPTLTKPILMLEIGSNSEAWKDTAINQFVVETVKSLKEYEPVSNEASIVIGGDHYMEKVSKLLSTQCLCHLCPSNQSHNFNEDMLNQAIRTCNVPIKNIIVDLSGVGQHYERIKKIVKKSGLPMVHLHELV